MQPRAARALLAKLTAQGAAIGITTAEQSLLNSLGGAAVGAVDNLNTKKKVTPLLTSPAKLRSVRGTSSTGLPLTNLSPLPPSFRAPPKAQFILCYLIAFETATARMTVPLT